MSLMKKIHIKKAAALAALIACLGSFPGCREAAMVPETEPAVPETTAATEEPVTETTAAAVETTVPVEPSEEQVYEGDYLKNILIVGQAYRQGEESKLADSIILATVDPKNKTVTLTSFLRDSYVQIPSYAGRTCGGFHRINIIYNLGCRWNGTYGGMEMMDKCLKESFGIDVDYNIEIDFETFYHIIDSMNGIYIDVTPDERDYLLKDKTGMNDHIEAGLNLVNGYTALCYARMRKIDSDIQRTERQRKVIQAALDRARGLKIHELAGLIGRASQMVVTDMSVWEIADLVRTLVPMLEDIQIVSAQCPADGTYGGVMVPLDGYMSSVIKFDLKKNREILEQRCEITEPTECEEETK